MKRDHNDSSLTLSFSDNDLSYDSVSLEKSLDQSDISFDVFGYLRNTFDEIVWDDTEIIFTSS